MTTGAEHRLAVYGTLAPGKPNHHQLAGLSGTWTPAVLRGQVFQEGWAAVDGYPGLRLDPAGPEIAALLFTSPDLPAHWDRLDAFEGDDYRRVTTEVVAEGETLAAQVYVIASAAAS